MNTEAIIQISIRLKVDDVTKIDQAAQAESDRTGYTVTRTDFCRAAIIRAASELANQSEKTSRGGK